MTVKITQPSPPRLRTYQAGDSTVVELHGGLDTYGAGTVTPRLDMLTADGPPRLVVDLRGMDFVDYGGLAVLCRAHHRAVARGGGVSLVVDDRHTLRTLHVTHLDQVFAVHKRVEDALTEPGADADVPVPAT